MRAKAEAKGTGGPPGPFIMVGPKYEQGTVPDGYAVERECTLPAGQPSMPLPNALREVWPEVFPTQSAARKRVRRREVSVNREEVGKCGRWVEGGEVIQLLLRKEGRTIPVPDNPITLEIVYEDEQMAVIVKPPGLATHDRGARSVKRALGYNLAPSSAMGALPRPQNIHRLDKPTGGLLVAGKTRAAVKALSMSFAARDVKKRYRAIVVGRLEGEGRVDEPIEGQHSLSLYQAVEHTPSLKFGWLTTVDLWPHTGRTHQLRRHMAFLGHPMLGDKQYSPRWMPSPGKGCFLWAVELDLPHPDDGRAMHFETAEPAKFATWREREARRFRELSKAAGPGRVVLATFKGSGSGRAGGALAA